MKLLVSLFGFLLITLCSNSQVKYYVYWDNNVGYTSSPPGGSPYVVEENVETWSINNGCGGGLIKTGRDGKDSVSSLPVSLSYVRRLRSYSIPGGRASIRILRLLYQHELSSQTLGVIVNYDISDNTNPDKDYFCEDYFSGSNVSGSVEVGISPPSPDGVLTKDLTGGFLSAELEEKGIKLSIKYFEDDYTYNPTSNFTYEIQTSTNGGATWSSICSGQPFNSSVDYTLPQVTSGATLTLKLRARVHRMGGNYPVAYSPWSPEKPFTVCNFPEVSITPASPPCTATHGGTTAITFSVGNFDSNIKPIDIFGVYTKDGQQWDEPLITLGTINAGGNFTSLPMTAGDYTIKFRAQDKYFRIRPSTYTINQPPAAPVFSAGSTSPCAGSTQTYSVTGVSGVSYSWAFPSDWTKTSGGTTNTATFTVGSASGSITVTPSNGSCGNGASTALGVTVSANPTITLSTMPSVCYGSTIASLPYTATTENPDQYSIDFNTGISDVVNAALTANQIPISLPNNLAAGTYSGTLVVRRSSTGCVSGGYSISVTVNANPTITLGALPSVCYGLTTANLPYSATTGNPDQYSIDFNTPANTAGLIDVAYTALTANQIPISLPNNLAAGTYSGTLSVRKSSTGCVSGNYAISVTVNDLPTPIINGLSTPCSGSISNVYATELGMTVYTWTVEGGTVSAGGIPTDNTVTVTWGPAGTGHVRVNYTDGNGCRATVQTDRSVTINPLPNSSFMLGDPVICYGKPAAIAQSAGENGVFYQLRIASDNVGDPIEGNGSPFSYPPVSPTATTEYNVLAIIDATGCSEILTDKATVTVNPLPLPALSGPTIACAGVSGNAYATDPGMTGYQWSVSGGTITSGGTPASSSATVTWDAGGVGTVSVSYTNANGCTAGSPTNLNVTVSSLYFSSQELTPVRCYGESSGAIRISVDGGVTPYAYTLKRGGIAVRSNSDGNFTGLVAAPDYTVTATDNSSCSIVSDNIPVDQPLSLGVTASRVDVSCHGAGNGRIAVSASGGTAPYRYSKDNGLTFTAATMSPSYTFAELVPGIYPVAVKDNNGCELTLLPAITIAEPSAALSASAVKVDVTCYGGSNGSITVSAAGGTPPYRYSKNCGATFTPAPAGPYTFAGLTSGTYGVAVKDTNGCGYDIPPISISQPTDPFSLTVTSSKSITCPGGSDGWAVLEVAGGTPGYEFSMDGSIWIPSSSTYTFNNLTYSSNPFSVRDSKGCIVTAVNPVTQPAPILPIAVITHVRCNGEANGKVNLTVSGGTSPYTYSWFKSGVGVSNSKDIFGQSAGDYKLVVKDNAGCKDSSTYVIIQPTTTLGLRVKSFVQPNCFGESNGSIQLDSIGGWGGYTFRIKDSLEANRNGLFTKLPKRDYTFSVTDSLGCTAELDTTLNAPNPLVLSTDITNLSCNGDGSGSIKVKAVGGSEGYSYKLSGGNILSTIRPDGIFSNLPAADNYWIKAIDVHGCSDSVWAKLTQPEPLTVSISNRIGNGLSINCPGKKDTIWVKPSGGTIPYTIEPSSGIAPSYYNKGFALYDKPNGKYHFRIVDENGCEKIDSALISNLPGPKFEAISITNAKCANTADGIITINTWSATGSETISWYYISATDTSLVASSADTVFSIARSGRYITIITDTLTCAHDTTITVGSPPAILLSLAKQRAPKCYGSTDGNLSVTASGRNRSDFKYAWYNHAHAKVSEADSTGDIPSGSYSVVVTDLMGCKDSSSYTIIDPPSLQPQLPSEVTICSNQTYQADAGVSGTSFLWSSAGGYSATGRTATLTDAGIYTLLVTNAKGCSGRDTLTLVKSGSIIDANFIMAERASVGDTIVIIEMSWPIPEAIEWVYPAAFREVFKTDYSVYLVPQMAGTFTIGLNSYLSICSAYIDKPITIGRENPESKGNTTKQALIREIAVFPNPSKGDFSVAIELNKECEATVEVYSVYGNRLLSRKVSGQTEYRVDVNLLQLPGIYLVRVAAGGESRSLRVVVK